MAIAVDSSPKYLLTMRSCPTSFWEINSRAIFRATPGLMRQEIEHVASRASDGRTGPVVASTEPSRSSMTNAASLIGKPAERGQRNDAIGPDQDETAKPVTDAR